MPSYIPVQVPQEHGQEDGEPDGHRERDEEGELALIVLDGLVGSEQVHDEVARAVGPFAVLVLVVLVVPDVDDVVRLEHYRVRVQPCFRRFHLFVILEKNS